jgi:hypothetical protein
MAHQMCVVCRIRSQTAAECDDSIDEFCPDCGSLLEPVVDLSSIVGFRSVSARAVSSDAGAAADQAQIAGRLEGIFSRRGAFLDLDRFDAEFDEYADGDGLCAGAVSLPWPDTTT